MVRGNRKAPCEIGNFNIKKRIFFIVFTKNITKKASSYLLVLQAFEFSHILIVWKWVPQSQTKWQEILNGFTPAIGFHQINGIMDTMSKSSMISKMFSMSIKEKSRMARSPFSSCSLCSCWCCWWFVAVHAGTEDEEAEFSTTVSILLAFMKCFLHDEITYKLFFYWFTGF